MEEVTTIAKHVFQVHGVDGVGKVLVRKQLGRAEVMRFFDALPPLVSMEACGAAHHWARELTKLGAQCSIDAASFYVARSSRRAWHHRCPWPWWGERSDHGAS
jgi:transposase